MHFDDIRAIPCLIEALEYNDPAMQAVANDQLPLLLARMQASDAPLLTKEHHTMLNKVLKLKVPRKRTLTLHLRVATLQALQQIGDASSLPIVEELANGNGQAKKYPELQQAAQDCLPFLRERAEHQQQTQTLLRASDGNITPVAMLLHPAMPAASVNNAAELLRIAPDIEEPPLVQLELPLNTQGYHTEETPIHQHVSSGPL